MEELLMTARIVLLHISDFHFGHDRTASKAERTNTLDGLMRDLNDLDDEWRPNCVCVSGDIGFAGRLADYEEAEVFFRKLLTLLKLDASRLILCPGNHDVNRTMARFNARPVGYDEADAVLQPAIFGGAAGLLTVAEHWCEPFFEYSEFCRRLGSAQFKLGFWDNYLVGTVDLLGARFLSINSSWFSKDNEDKGKLFLGLPQLQLLQSGGQLPSEDLLDSVLPIIGLVHHPPEYLHEGEINGVNRSSSFNFVCNRVHVLLTGHTHAKVCKPNKLQEAWHFAGGASYASATHPNFFRLIRLHDCYIDHRAFEFDRDGTNNVWSEYKLRSSRQEYQSAWCAAPISAMSIPIGIADSMPPARDIVRLEASILTDIIRNGGQCDKQIVCATLALQFSVVPQVIDYVIEQMQIDGLVRTERSRLFINTGSEDDLLVALEVLYQHGSGTVNDVISGLIPVLEPLALAVVLKFLFERFQLSFHEYFALAGALVSTVGVVNIAFLNSFTEALADEFRKSGAEYDVYSELISSFSHAEDLDIEIGELEYFRSDKLAFVFAGKAFVSADLYWEGGADATSFHETFPATFIGSLDSNGLSASFDVVVASYFE
jgi:calcineurin-like phosphoesterase family protein